MKKTSIWIIILIAVILIPGILRKRKSTHKRNAKSIPVVLSTVTNRTINMWMSFSVATKGINQALVYADLPGKFMRFVVSEGQFVKKDNIIAYIEREAPGVEIKPIPIKSPLNGIVSLFSFNKGQIIKPNIPVAQVASIDKIKVEFSLPQNYKITKDTPVKLEVSSLDRKIKGKINWLSDFPDPVSKTWSVAAIFPNHTRQIKPGMFARVWVLIETKKCTAVPDESVLGTSKKFLFIAKGKRAHLVSVETGISNGFYTEIVKGIREGDTILIEGQNVVKDGSPIKIEGVK